MTDPVLPDLVAAIGLAVIERLPNGSFNPIAPLPDWLEDAFDLGPHGPQATLAGALPFLDEFLPRAEDAWHMRRTPLGSGPFVATIAGRDVLLRATALMMSDRSLLLLERLTGDADTRPILQKAREAELEHERVVKEIGEIRAPAAAMARDLGQLLATDLTAEQRRLVEDLRRAAATSQAALDALPTAPRAHRRKDRG